MRIEIRWHGRGGQGAVTAAEILAAAAIRKGLYAQAFPEFGAERRGAPVVAFNRIADSVIYEREPVLNPDYVVVLDSSLPPSIYMSGLKRDGGLVVNTRKSVEEFVSELRSKGFEPPRVLALVDATSIALKHLKAPIVNTAMLGAFVRVSGIVELSLVEEVLRERFADRPHLIEPNINAMREAYNSVVIVEARVTEVVSSGG